MKLGKKKSSTEFEVDEVTCRGSRHKNEKRITWYQHCGLMRRGDRRSLAWRTVE
jgi:hypothetical protein